jgi:hypothetical protein
MNNHHKGTGTKSMGRREVLKAAAAGIGLAMIPAIAFAKSVKPTALAPTVGMGFWQHPTTVNLNKPDDVVVDASTVSAGAGGMYKLQVLSAVSTAQLAIDAEYQGGAAHRFWQSWSEGGLLQKSPTSAIRWSAKDRRALQLTVWSGGAASVVQLPARAGTYVLAIAPNAALLPAWSDLALHQTMQKNPRSLQLVKRGGTRVAFPYLIFGVEQIIA